MPEGIATRDAWSSPAGGALRDLDRGWVLGTWVLAELLTVALSAVVLFVVQQVGAFDVTLGPAIWTAAVASFVAFLVVLRVRLLRLATGRFTNAVLVGAAHCATCAVAIVALLAAGQYGVDLALVQDSFALSISAALVVFASLISAAILPEQGSVPSGTQHEASDELHQL